MTFASTMLQNSPALLVLWMTPFISHAGINGTPVPEPDTIALFALGAIGVALIRKIRKK